MNDFEREWKQAEIDLVWWDGFRCGAVVGVALIAVAAFITLVAFLGR